MIRFSRFTIEILADRSSSFKYHTHLYHNRCSLLVFNQTKRFRVAINHHVPSGERYIIRRNSRCKEYKLVKFQSQQMTSPGRFELSKSVEKNRLEKERCELMNDFWYAKFLTSEKVSNPFKTHLSANFRLIIFAYTLSVLTSHFFKCKISKRFSSSENLFHSATFWFIIHFRSLAEKPFQNKSSS